jgi:hypothetical protein
MPRLLLTVFTVSAVQYLCSARAFPLQTTEFEPGYGQLMIIP